MATLMEQFGKLMLQLKGVIKADSGQDAWVERVNIISQAVSVMGEDYVMQLKDGGIMDQKIDAAQVTINMQNTDLDAELIS